tara:strand:- start:121 stop:477 length:357 start_codon:yes stop_codon:yes gene_type:complete
MSGQASTMSDKDVEQGGNGYVKKAATPSYQSGSIREPNYEETTIVHQPYYRRVLESFKRDPLLKITPNGVIGANGHVFHSEAAAQNTANSPLARKLKGRHLQMIAIGGSIGKCQQCIK